MALLTISTTHSSTRLTSTGDKAVMAHSPRIAMATSVVLANSLSISNLSV